MIRHNSKLPGPFFLLAIFFWICQFPGILELGNHSNQRLETRFNHLTVFRGTDVLEHEDMRDIISLEPVFNARSGKLKYHIASFPTGHQIKIFANLDRHDELIAKLQSYLPSAS